jgi:D-3-phosphoglycerate dehydrogenase
VPLTASTENLINKAVFDKMKKVPVFVNTARGGIVDQKALCEALKSGQIKGAGLDVLVQEPPDFNDEIFTFDNVIITPHAAFYSETALEEVRRRSAENVTNFLQGNMDKVSFVV